MSVISTANSLLGRVKYSFGSNSITSSGGVGDCSSFVQYVFKQNGLNLPRTAESQYNSDKGKKVDKNNLQVGDVVFFKGTYKSGISHVGIYAGNGEFIHNSSAKGGTVKSSLNSDYYKNHYAGAVRYTGVNGGNNNKSIVSIAESLKGHVKYDYNHKNSYTKKDGNLYVDCAGFVTYVLRKAGLIDNKTSMTNYYKKSGVQNVKNLNDLRAGDVLYYADKNGKVWHMNIYAGNGYVIESTRSVNGWRKVKMTDKYKKEFLTAVRFPSQSETETSENTETETSKKDGGIVWGSINRFAGGIITIISLIILFILMIYLLTQSFKEGE